MKPEIEQIKKSLRIHLEDLHIIISERGVNIDSQYYNDVTLALLQAEDAIKAASKAHEERIQKHMDKYRKAHTAKDWYDKLDVFN